MKRGPVAIGLVLLAVGAVVLAGCSSPSGSEAADCDETYGTMQSLWPHHFVAGQDSDFLYLGDSPDVGPTNLTLDVNDGSLEGIGYGHGVPLAFQDIRFTPAVGERHFGAFRLSPDVVSKNGDARLILHAQDRPADCDDRAGGFVGNWGATEVEGRAAEPGQGAHVWYAGFWENGTLFDTNLQDLDLSPWPKAGWYEGGHWQPIPVYVYDQERSEQPAYWKDPFAGTPSILADVDEAAGAGYFTTIKGFNEAVKGLPAGAHQVFHIAPEDAYTQPGREDHPLYGDALVFLVEVEDVVDAPCPEPPVLRGCSSLSQRVPPV